MSDSITAKQLTYDLVLAEKTPLDRNPAAVYLASLSQSGRRTQRAALDKIAAVLTGGEADAFNCHWGALRYQHAAALRSLLAERYAPATANKMLSALRRVVKEAWKLGYVSAEIYQRVASVENVKGETLPTGRELFYTCFDGIMMPDPKGDSRRSSPRGTPLGWAPARS